MLRNKYVYALVAAVLLVGVAAFAPDHLITAGLVLTPLAAGLQATLPGLVLCDDPASTLSPEKLREAILESLNVHNKGLNEKLQKAQDDVKQFGVVTEETRKAIEELGKKGVKIEEDVAKQFQELSARLLAAEQKIVAGEPAKPQRLERLGKRAVESREIKEYTEKFKPSSQGAPIRKFRGRSEEFVLGSFEPYLNRRDITSVEGSGGSGIWSERQPEIVSEPYRPLSIRNLIPSISVTSNLIEYVRTKTRTSNVAHVSEGAGKPKSDLAYERKETAIRKIGHYIKASMEVLADFPRLQAIINTELLMMLKVYEEDALLLGDGTADTILGLIPQATAYDTGLNRPNDTRLDVIRHALLQVSESFYAPTGIVVSPRDWERIELTKDDMGRYVVATATETTGPRLWGHPVVPSHAMPHGEFMVGAFATAAELYDRMIASIFISTENEDDFINNMVTILAEERLGLAVKRPLAFVHGSFDDAGLSTGA